MHVTPEQSCALQMRDFVRRRVWRRSRITWALAQELAAQAPSGSREASPAGQAASPVAADMSEAHSAEQISHSTESLPEDRQASQLMHNMPAVLHVLLPGNSSRVSNEPTAHLQPGISEALCRNCSLE